MGYHAKRRDVTQRIRMERDIADRIDRIIYLRPHFENRTHFIRLCVRAYVMLIESTISREEAKKK